MIREPKPPFSAPEEKLAPGLRVFVREIKVSGSTVFSLKELSEVSAHYVNRELTSEDLEALRRALTTLYINKGYINSGAVIPDQAVVGGVINIQIVEGKLTDVEVQGNRWLRTGYYVNRIALDSGPPVNVYCLQQRLQLLQQDERVDLIHAELKPGLEPGQSDLAVRVEEKLPFSASVGFDNYQPSTVGEKRGFMTLVDKSLTGYGDILSFTYFGSEGVNPGIDVWYSLPITSRDTTLVLRYERNDFGVIEQPFGPLNITTNSDIYGITLRQPLYRSLNQEFAVAVAGEYEQDRSFLLGEPFSFAPGEQDGKSTVTALRFSQEWFYRTQTEVLAARSRLSFGLDAFGSTINPGGLPDSRFFSWLGQFQWARVFGSYGIQSIVRADVQLAADPLLPLEQIPVGGRYSVRGYPENTFVRDNAVIPSWEIRVPVVRDVSWADYLQLAPFIDYGLSWNTRLPTPPEDSLLSVGIGLRWALTMVKRPFPVRPEFEIYWGYPIESIKTNGHDLQDLGIHMQFVIVMF
jgi:hemolysin activation/secretion protein